MSDLFFVVTLTMISQCPSCRGTWIDATKTITLLYATFTFPELDLLLLFNLAIFYV